MARCSPGGTVVEGTAGNTGIGIAHICNVRGYGCIIYMPDNQSQEKVDILRTLGAEVRVVKTVPYKDPMNYQKQAGRFAAELPDAVWANQFDNVANRHGALRVDRARKSGPRRTAASMRSRAPSAPAARWPASAAI